MARRKTFPPLHVLLNNRLVGHLSKEPSGAIAFSYDPDWLSQEKALPVSLSLPLREDVHHGAPVAAVFENLLPDSEALRRRVAEKVGAQGTDAYSMLARIGRDCVGALQFVGAGDDIDRHAVGVQQGEPVDDAEIEKLLNGLASAPLGLNRDDPFRISVAGAQEKTALLYDAGQWIKPHGTTPTTHILKTRIGTLPNGIDLADSVENEFYCLKLCDAFGLPVNDARMMTFGNTRALVIERFDRLRTEGGRLLRLPQEDCCQALSVPPMQKYQSEGGPGLARILDLLKGSDTPADDQRIVLAAQLIFWLIGATDGHAKNFSIFLNPGGGYRLTPLYDILSAQPSLENHQIRHNQMRLAMSVGHNRHYRLDEVQPRHFLETAKEAGIAASIVHNAIDDILGRKDSAFDTLETSLPDDFPEEIHTGIKQVATGRLAVLEKFRERET